MHIFFLPFARVKFYCPISPQAVGLLLQRAVPPQNEKTIACRSTDQEYFGSLLESNFHLIRNLNYRNKLFPLITSRNPFVPIIKGKILPYKDETKIIITASFSLIVLIVSLIFYTAFIVPLVAYFSIAINNKAINWNIMSFLILPLGFYLWQIISFSTEIEYFKKYLKRVVRTNTNLPTESIF